MCEILVFEESIECVDHPYQEHTIKGDLSGGCLTDSAL